jgi:predicted transposase YdaD
VGMRRGRAVPAKPGWLYRPSVRLVGRRLEDAAADIEVAKRKGIYKGRRKGTTKAEPTRATQLRERGLTVAEIATALGANKRTVQRYVKASPATAKLSQN